MLGRAGGWVNANGGGANLTDARVWTYQDFAAGSGPGLTITASENGDGISFDASRIVDGSAAVTKTNGNPIYDSATEIPANIIEVSAHTGDSVTLDGTPAVGQGSVRIWYLYAISNTDSTHDMEIAPHFVIASRSIYLDAQFLNTGLNLSDLQSAPTARLNLGFTAQTAGQVLYGDGGTTFNSESALFWDSSNDRLGIGTSLPSQQLHLQKTTGSAVGLIETISNGNAALLIMEAARNAGANLQNGDIAARIAGLGKANSSYLDLSFIDSVYTGDGTTQVGDIVFQTANSGAPAEKARLNGAGLFTVGSSSLSQAGAFSGTEVDLNANSEILRLLPNAAMVDSYDLTFPDDQGGSGDTLVNDGSGNLSWAPAGTGTVGSGTAGNLALYPASSDTVDDVYVQNANNITVGIATHAGLASARAYTIPNAGADASFIMSEGNQTLDGTKTFEDSAVFQAGISLQETGGGSDLVTLNAAASSAAYALVLPDAQGAAGTTLENNGSGTLSWVPRGTVPLSGQLSLVSGTTSRAVVFNTPLGSANYTPGWSFINTVDTDPMYQPVTVIAQDGNGFTVEWNEPLDSNNYIGRWTAVIDNDP